MKSIIKSAVFAMVVFIANVLHAQLQLSSADLAAIESTTPTDQLPVIGTFYSAANPQNPPAPANIFELPCWALGNDMFLLDDLNGTGEGFHAMDDSGPPGFGDTNGGGSNIFSGGSFTFSTNGLWLSIANATEGTIYANLNNATDYVYAITSATNLTASSNIWNIETEVFPGISTNSMPFTVSMNGRNSLFLSAMDWTGITASGNQTPSWWFYYWFGLDGLDLSDTNLDSVGQELMYDYQDSVDPNIIFFSLQFPNVVHTDLACGTVAILGGTPFYVATLVNDTNQADAVWQPYTGTNLAVSLNSGNGVYSVSVGLRGLPSHATITWVPAQVILDVSTPALIVTSPASRTVSQPVIQLQGLVSETLSNLTYDVSNALGTITGQQGYWNAAFFDTNVLDFTTNDFQCYDIPLTNGLNTITLHATDLQGNTATTHVSFTLDYSSATNPPALSILWPPNGTVIGGSNVTLQAQVNDDTATVTAQITDTYGDTNIVQGLVERSGLVWVNNLPLAAGTNMLAVTATDAAGNSMTTNLTLVQSTVLVTVNPLPGSELNQPSVTVTGTVSDTNGTVYVNGVQATVHCDGVWTACMVPVSPTGTALFNVQVYSGDPELEGSQFFDQPQSPVVALSSYTSNYGSATTVYNDCPGGPAPYASSETVNWLYQPGGADVSSGSGINGGDCEPVSQNSANSLSGGYNGYSPTWETASVSGSIYDPPEWLWVNILGVTNFWTYFAVYTVGSWSSSVAASVMIVPSDQAAVGQKALYLVSAQVTNEDTGNQLPGSALSFMNQVPGTPVMDVTNGDGSVWSQFLASGPAGTNFAITPIADGRNISFSGMLATNVTLQIIDANTGTNLTAQANTVIVGQQINLGCQLNVTNALLSNSMLTNFQWTVPGDAISNYVANGQSGTVYTNFATTNSTAVFYWVDATTNRIVQVSATVSGATVAGQATFNLIAPSANLIAFTNGPVAVDAGGDIPGGGISLHWGDPPILAPTTNYGIVVWATNIVLNGCPGNSTFLFVQTGTIQAEHNYTNGTSLRYSGSGLDSYYPAGNFEAYDEVPLPYYVDYPAEPVAGSAEVWRSDTFTSYLLFQPPTSNSIPVPLKKLQWSWSGLAQINGADGWEVLSSSTALYNVNVNAGYPTWTSNTINGVTITGNSWITPFP